MFHFFWIFIEVHSTKHGVFYSLASAGGIYAVTTACVCVCVCDTLLATTFSQGFEVGSVSYLSRVFATLSRRTLFILKAVKGHVRSTEVKHWKPCDHVISAIVQWIVLILGVHIANIELMIPIHFEGGPRSYEVNRGQKLKTLWPLTQFHDVVKDNETALPLLVFFP